MNKLFTTIVLLSLLSCNSQPRLKSAGPLATVKLVADKIIRQTPFKFQLVLHPAGAVFDYTQFVDMGRTFGLGKPAVAYAVSRLESRHDTTFTIQVSHNDGLKIWINGEVVYNKPGQRKVYIQPRERDIVLESEFTARLKKGGNSILVKSETQGREWIFYLQPKGALIEERKPANPTLSLSGMQQVTAPVARLSSWLVAGPFKDKGLDHVYGPEQGFEPGQMFPDGDKSHTWTLPKIEVWGDVIDPQQYWGTYYNWNYHAGGVAWAMARLAKETGEHKYADYANNWTDFMIRTRPFIGYQVNTLNGFQSVNHQLYNTPLLDFTAAPAMPFINRLVEQKEFQNRHTYLAMVDSVKAYVLHRQIRLPGGNFTRETPQKYTTWVDDMFMGIPFIIQASMLTADPKEKELLLNDAAQQVLAFDQQLFDPAADLYQHARYSIHPKKMPYWSRANGWGIWATTEVLASLPAEHPQRKAIMALYLRHVASLVKLQNKHSGFWHNVLDRPDSYEELSGTAIFTMAIARGINMGWLDRLQYEKYAQAGWEAVRSSISADGTVHNICIGTMSSEDVNYYMQRPRVDDDSHGLIGLIFAGIEMERLNGKR